jgi:hypothetical protein
MGGNVIIDGISADRIDLHEIDRESLVSELTNLLSGLNQMHNTFYGEFLWNESLFNSKHFLSGSSIHFFNTEGISTGEFISNKSSIGDIDLMVDVNQKDTIRFILDRLSCYHEFYKWEMIGYKTSAGQFITLWHLRGFNLNVQIDFELVEYNDGIPTEWSSFSHSSSWSDITSGIKGFHHKYLLQSIAASRTKERIVLLTGKSKKHKIVEKSQLAFSVQRGLRWRYINTGLVIDGLNVFDELTSDESTFHTDLQTMSNILFDGVVIGCIEEMKSFVGCIDLIKQFIPEHSKSIVDDYVGRMFSCNSQMIVRDNHVGDYNEKIIGFLFILEKLNVEYSEEYRKMILEYYANH